MSVNDPGCVKTQCPAVMISLCMGATHFLTKTLPKVAAEMALSVLAYNLTRVMNIVGIKPLIAAITGLRPKGHGFSPTSQEGRFYTAKT